MKEQDSQKFIIGVIVGAHGVRGDVKVYPITDEPEKFLRLETAEVHSPRGITRYEVKNAQFHKKFVLLKLDGVDTVEAANALKKAEIKVSRADAVPLSDGEYYISDLYDMNVTRTDGEFLGIITDVLRTGANDVYEVTKESGDTPKPRKLYVPAIKQCIKSVDVAGKKMVVELLDGLESL